MRALLKIQNPEEVEVSLTITMKVSDWRRLSGQLSSDWPSWKFGSMISALVAKATKFFDASDEVAP